MTTPPRVDPNQMQIGAYVKAAIDMFLRDPLNWLFIGLVGTVVISVGFWGGFQHCVLKELKGEKPTVTDVLAPFSRFVDFFIPMLITGIGFALCVVPGVFLLAIWFFAIPLLIEKGSTWKEATEESASLLKPALVPSILVSVIGLLLSGVLGFATAPLFGMIQVFAYHHVTRGTLEGTSEEPPL